MNRLEYEEVLKVAGIYNPVAKIIRRDILEESYTHEWNGFTISFNKCPLIEGRIPLTVAKAAHRKYCDSPLDSKGCTYRNFIDDAVDDIYLNDVKEIDEQRYDLSIGTYVHWLELAKHRMNNRRDDDKYLKEYGFQRKEAFLHFLLLLKDHILKKNGLPESELARFDELKKELYVNIAKRFNPSISPYLWMQQDNKNRKLYNDSNEQIMKFSQRTVLKGLIEEFDRAVNPFMNGEVDIESLNDIDNIYVAGNVEDDYDENDKKRKNCGHLTIEDKDGMQNHMQMSREAEGFQFLLNCTTPSGGNLYIKHYFGYRRDDIYTDGEMLILHYTGPYGEKICNYNVNLTRGIFLRDTGNNNHPVEIDYEPLIEYLKYGIRYANSFLYDKINGSPKVKQIL